MDDLGLHVPFKSISGMAERWKGDHEGPCNEEYRLPQDSNMRPHDPKWGAVTVWLRGRFTLHKLIKFYIKHHLEFESNFSLRPAHVSEIFPIR